MMRGWKREREVGTSALLASSRGAPERAPRSRVGLPDSLWTRWVRVRVITMYLN